MRAVAALCLLLALLCSPGAALASGPTTYEVDDATSYEAALGIAYPGDIIKITTETIALRADRTLTTDNLTIAGKDEGTGSTLDGQDACLFVYLDTIDNTITLKNLTLRNGYHGQDGGAIYSSGKLTINTGDTGSVVFRNNRAGNYGGAIYAGDYLTINTGDTGSVVFRNNRAGNYGGAIHSSGNLTINTGDTGSVVFRNNSAGNYGGAIIANGMLTLGKNINFGLADDEYSGNSALNGGAISTWGMLLNATAGPVNFYYNKADNQGGAIYTMYFLDINTHDDGSMTFRANSAGRGGAIYVGSHLRIFGTALFANNSAEQGGGAIYTEGPLTLDTLETGDIHFTGNKVGDTPNAITMDARGLLTLSGQKSIVFDDPISHDPSSGAITLTSSAALVQFAGFSTLSGSTGGQATVTDGIFRVLSNAQFNTGGATSAYFNVENKGTLSGAGTIATPGSMTISGTISPTGQRYTPNSTSLANKGSTSADSTATLKLSATSGVTLNGATLDITIDDSGASDKIAITGKVSSSAANTVKASKFREGAYYIMTWTGTGFTDTNAFTVDRSSYNSRQVTSLSLGPQNNKLFLIMRDLDTDLTWTGDTDNHWVHNDGSNVNWDADGVSTVFINGSNVTFGSTSGPKGITVDANGVTVNAMTVTDHDYGFFGGQISGNTLNIAAASGSHISFYNPIHFDGGITVADGNALRFRYSTGEPPSGFTGSGSISGKGKVFKDGNAALNWDGNIGAANARLAAVEVQAGELNIASGKKLYADTVSIGTEASLGLYAGISPAVFAGTLGTSSASVIDIIGFTSTDANHRAILVQADTDIVRDYTIRAGGTRLPMTPTLDTFFIVQEDRSNAKQIAIINPVLVWDLNRDAAGNNGPAHGTFNIASRFEVDSVLANNPSAAGGTGMGGWDGTTLTKKGAGTLVLSGNNTYTGKTTIEAGTLQIGKGGTSGSIASSGSVYVAGGATLAFNRSDAHSYGGIISGAGQLIKYGAGTLTLANANYYTGATTIYGGTLEVAGTLGGGYYAGGIYTAGTLRMNQGASQTLAGAISGPGRLEKTGAGTLSLTGRNTYTGGTFINRGNLVATTANLPAGRAVSVAGGASLTLNQAGKGTFSGAISGAGSLIKNGKGMLTLSGASSHSGATKVNAGGITLTGKLTKSPVTVAKNATFTAKAKGALGKALTVSKKGTLQIGNKGTLAKTTLNKGAFLQLVNNNKATTLKNALKLHKSAKVTLSGKKWKAGKTYTVLSAKKTKYLKGFTQRAIQSNIIDATLRQGTGKKAKTLQLTVTSTNKAGKAAKNGNAKSALTAVSSLSDKSVLYRGIDTAATSSLEASGRQLSGQDMAALSGNLASLSRAFAPRNLNRLSGNTVALNPRFASFAADAYGDGGGFAALPALAGTDSARSILSFNGLTLNAWSSHTGGDASITSKGGAGDSAIYGPESSGGYDLRFDSGYLLGASFRSGTKAMGEHGANSSASLESYSFAMYGGKEFNAGPGVLRLLAGAATSYHDISSNRSVKVNGVKQGLSADYTARSTQFFTELAYAMPLADILVMEPFASVTLDSTKTGAFKESGGPAALYGAARTQQTAATLLGLRAHLPATERFAFTAELGWQRNHGDLEYSGKYRFAEGGEEFGVKGNKLNRDAAAVAFGVDFTPSDSFKLNLGYQGQMGARSTDQSANLNVMWEF